MRSATLRMLRIAKRPRRGLKRRWIAVGVTWLNRLRIGERTFSKHSQNVLVTQALARELQQRSSQHVRLLWHGVVWGHSREEASEMTGTQLFILLTIVSGGLTVFGLCLLAIGLRRIPSHVVLRNGRWSILQQLVVGIQHPSGVGADEWRRAKVLVVGGAISLLASVLAAVVRNLIF